MGATEFNSRIDTSPDPNRPKATFNCDELVVFLILKCNPNPNTSMIKHTTPTYKQYSTYQGIYGALPLISSRIGLPTRHR